MDRRGLARLLVLASMVLLMAVQALAQSANGPDPADAITAGDSGSYKGLSSGYAIGAAAGNVTALTISNIQSTRFWQGYYGNISGEIVLDDASNNTLYSWALATPSGEIYAVNHSLSVSWRNITCVNLTNTTGGLDDMAWASKINRTTIQSAYNLTDSDYENLTGTFNQTLDTNLVIAARTITAAASCPQLNTYVNNAWQQTSFNEVLLYDNATSLIFATILENNVDGFRDGGDDLHDFQLMVLEDGTPGGPDTSTTQYYFYVELD
jgi:hypothetical protein